MAPAWTTTQARAVRRGRAALMWGLGLCVAAQLGLALALSRSWGLRDPEYGRRLATLRARLAERGPGRKLVLMLGSSRVGVNVRPALLAANQPASGQEAVVFNFGLCGARPVMELLCLERLLADGIHPDTLLF